MATQKNIYDNQIQNRNFLSPIGFRFTLQKSPKVAFFSNQANIPALDFGVATQTNYLRDIPHLGDKMEFEDFSLRFLVDENLENYMEIQNWMRGIAFPESLQQIYDIQRKGKNMDLQPKTMLNVYSDATLLVLTSNNTSNFKIKFRDIFPISLSTLTFDATSSDVEYFTAEVRFKYLMYNITDMNGNDLHPL
jgi:hypothetical protein